MEKFRSLLPMSTRGAQVIIVVFDVTSRKSFESCDNYIKDFDQNGDVFFAVFGGKIDLEYKREVSYEEACKHFNAMKQSIPYFEVSAKTGKGVNEAFEGALKTALKNFGRLFVSKNTEHHDDYRDCPVK